MVDSSARSELACSHRRHGRDKTVLSCLQLCSYAPPTRQDNSFGLVRVGSVNKPYQNEWPRSRSKANRYNQSIGWLRHTRTNDDEQEWNVDSYFVGSKKESEQIARPDQINHILERNHNSLQPYCTYKRNFLSTIVHMRPA